MLVYQLGDEPVPGPETPPSPSYTTLGCAADFEDPNRVRNSSQTQAIF